MGCSGTRGCRWPDSVNAFHAFGSYILGSVTMELGPTIAGSADEAHVRAHTEMARLAASVGLPRIAEALPSMVDCDFQEQFEFGLDLLIEAVQARLPTPPG